MKHLYFFILLFFGFYAKAQIEHEVNTNTGTQSLPINQIDSIRFNPAQTEMQILLNNGSAVIHSIQNVVNVTFSSELVGEVDALDCQNAIVNGSLISNVSTSSPVLVQINYTGGNGGVHYGQVVNSTGITGLTAVLDSGSFVAGSGVLIYSITGTPSSSGSAFFVIDIGGRICVLTVIVEPGSISSLDCASPILNGTLVEGVAANSVSAQINYVGGNGGAHAGQTVNSTGVLGLTATLAAGSFSNGAGVLNYGITGTPNANGIANFNISIGGEYCTLSLPVDSGSVSSLQCSIAVINGSILEGVSTTGVFAEVDYLGGNGGPHSGQIANSTGVTGLVATLAPGNFSIGAGTLTYSITGTPNVYGLASFHLEVGGESCTLDVLVDTNLALQYPPGSVFCSSGPTKIVDVTNPITGHTWMDRNLGASQVPTTANTDTSGFGDLYQWGRRSDGHQCRSSSLTTALSIGSSTPPHGDFILAPTTPFDWRSPSLDTLWHGVDGVNNPCPTGYRIPTAAELNLERLSWSSNNAAGAFTSPLKLPIAGTRNSTSGLIQVVGSFGRYWSSAVSTTGGVHYGHSLIYTLSSAVISNSGVRLAAGHSVRCIKDEGLNLNLDCSNPVLNGVLAENSIANGATVEIDYTGGNGTPYNGFTINSTGVTGLMITLNLGTLNYGNGTLVFHVTGTPTSSGTAVFPINFGTVNCSLNLNIDSSGVVGSFHSNRVVCNGTAVVDVFSPATGKVWMDRNLGASRVATSSTDVQAYGDLYQWGRRADGHQCRNSPTTSSLSSVDQPTHGSFITTNNTSPNDWRSPQNNNLWQGVNGINNPCPIGYRLPTETEFNAERASWSNNNAAGAFASPLKLPLAGIRSSAGGIWYVNTHGFYWSSALSVHSSRILFFRSDDAYMTNNGRSEGLSVRCIRDDIPPPEIDSLHCSSALLNGMLAENSIANGATINVNYSGGNGMPHAGFSVNSTGVLGLTATLDTGILALGSGMLLFEISGTPSSNGIVTFPINFASFSCNLSFSVDSSGAIGSFPAGTVICNGTAVVDVTNPITGKTWMDRNLGASRVAISTNGGSHSRGDLYQWGRGADGHQCRNSPTTSSLSSVDQPSHGSFITSGNMPRDWRSSQNNNLWQGVNGINNPCPIGYRLPTETELNAERASWGGGNNITGAFASPLKFTSTGYRWVTGPISATAQGHYWSSTVSGTQARALTLSSSAFMSDTHRAIGNSVRCIKD